MTQIKKEAMELLEHMPDEKVIYILQILHGLNGLDFKNVDDSTQKRKAYEELKLLQLSVPELDERKELETYREERYGRADIG